jgi:cellulose synthase/poly-beta-1,6-N-acetylglucosamine synthase-like glycosyltransferase
MFTAKPRSHASGKVAALLTALSKTKGQADMYALVDGDSLIPANWLTELVDSLLDESIGATTAFRWYSVLARVRTTAECF